jgi:hypothetical protein
MGVCRQFHQYLSQIERKWGKLWENLGDARATTSSGLLMATRKTGSFSILS